MVREVPVYTVGTVTLVAEFKHKYHKLGQGGFSPRAFQAIIHGSYYSML